MSFALPPGSRSLRRRVRSVAYSACVFAASGGPHPGGCEGDDALQRPPATPVASRTGRRRLASGTEATSLWRRLRRDREGRHRGKNIELEVHWRLTNVWSLANEGVDFTALQPVKVSSSAIISTLPPAQLFIYLCVHGASHAWNRLK